MYIKETKNLKEIESILFDNYIWDCISDDNTPNKEDINLLNYCHKYVGGYTDDGCIFSIMCYHYINKELFCHIHVLPKYRKEYALEFGKKVLENETETLYTKIPYNHRHIVNFAKKFGFEVIDYYDDGSIKNGKHYKTYKLKREI